MKNLLIHKYVKASFALAAPVLLTASMALGMVTPNTRTFTAGEKTKVNGVIISKEGDALKVRTDDDSVGTIDISPDTKIELKKSWGRKSKMDAAALVPGLRIEAQGQGNDKGDLAAT